MAPEMQPWADQPFALITSPLFEKGKIDSITLIATEMCCVHNSLLRGLNSIYLQATSVEIVDYKPFIGFALAWHKLLSHHHDSEERYFFAELQKQLSKDAMRQSLEEHRAFHEGTGRYKVYLSSLIGQESTFSGKKLVEIIDSFAPALLTHLNNEIHAILDLQRFNKDQLVLSIWNEAVKTGTKDLSLSDFFDEFPLGFLTHDITFEGGLHTNFPPVPFVIKIFVVYICSLWNWRWWKFAPCDRSGRPRILAAVPAEAVETEIN